MDNHSYSIEQLLSVAAHDIKQPLNILQMYMGLLQKKANLSADDELTTVANHSLGSMQAMLSLLSNWARTQQRQLKAHPTEISADTWFDAFRKLRSWKIVIPPVFQDDNRQTNTFDHGLLLQTLDQMGQLLPEESRLAIHSTPWSFEITSMVFTDHGDDSREPEYIDTLYQLAIIAGTTILSSQGFKHQFTPASEANVIQLSIRFAD